MRIEHIDAIARKVQRDVLHIAFNPPSAIDAEGNKTFFDWKTLPIRQQVIDWLESKGIGWRCCGHFANVNLMASYRGQIYVEVPFDQSNPDYKALTLFLENPDGSMRFPDCTFYYTPLEDAMKNSEHDEPGFWERWAEGF
jgi:hypothetical protein